MRPRIWNRARRAAACSSALGTLAFAIASPASAQLRTVSSAQQVFVVDDDGGPGVDFDELSVAAEAVGPGAVLLIRSGTYSSSITIDQPMSLIADEGAIVTTAGILVRNVPRGEVILHGLNVAPGLGFTVSLENVSGPVLIQDCTLSGGTGVTHVGGGPGISASNCQSVTLVNCTVYGGSQENGAPSTAAFASNSLLGLFGTEIEAASGDPGIFLSPPEDGGAGLVALNTLVFCQATSIRGGAGGDAGSSCEGADGGAGVELRSLSDLRVLDSTFGGGVGGTPQTGCSPGATGADIDQGTGAVVQHPGAARSFATEAVLREQQTGTFTVHGQPGDLVVLGAGYELAGQSFLTPFDAPLSIAFPPPGLRLTLGTVPPSGVLSHSFSLNLPTGLSFTKLEFQLQPIVLNGTDAFLGNTRRLLLLNPRY